ncbi:ABC transporter ATP-binding protein [Ornithinimicrobium avium]|uniref:ABC-type quaternary amine transporter n=1 Tax=Ornithinimicrobium avium TaxID=2283195 RepID=A0A345NSQ0_9MICO|nr:ABC transporter ATP-binding protein [Ornithinimicrobium avium]
MSEVRVRGVRAGYGGNQVLHDVDLTVRAGTTTAVLGGSGSGKTTLLRVISGFLRPTTGSVSIGGRVVADEHTLVPPERRGIGYVRQDGGLFPHLTVAGNIAFGLPRPAIGRRDRHHRERIAELLELVELPPEVAGRRPDQLSGGQQQRVALARALAPHPDLVLLDEPFSSLDTALRAATREATARALRAAGATAVLVTHDQGEALSFADEVAILRQGRFRQVAAPRAVYGEPVDAHVATFLGDAIYVHGLASRDQFRCALGNLQTAGFVTRGAVEALLRPEQLQIVPPGTGSVDARVRSVTFFGHDSVADLELVSGVPVNGLRARTVGLRLPEVGDVVGINVVGPVRVFPSS